VKLADGLEPDAVIGPDRHESGRDGIAFTHLANIAIYSQDVEEALVQVNILGTKNRLSQLIKAVRAGEEVIIANRGEPVVRLVPAGAAPAATADTGNARAILDWLRRHPLPDYARRSAEEIDSAIRLERSSWD
jgi:antitoxin (DNA-binding transcriptional repressor) of toxin-antitoxin stability system